MIIFLVRLFPLFLHPSHDAHILSYPDWLCTMRRGTKHDLARRMPCCAGHRRRRDHPAGPNHDIGHRFLARVSALLLGSRRLSLAQRVSQPWKIWRLHWCYLGNREVSLSSVAFTVNADAEHAPQCRRPVTRRRRSTQRSYLRATNATNACRSSLTMYRGDGACLTSLSAP